MNHAILVPHNINHLNTKFFLKPMRTVWSGSIAFGLVTIPIKLYSAISSKTGHFRLLHSKHPAPIRYKRVCEKCQKEVPWEEVEKGVEVAKNKFVMLTQEEIKKIRPGKTDTIDIKELKQAPKISKEEFKLATELIEKITIEEFKIEKYEDTFSEDLKKLLKKKEKDLIAALKESLK